MEKMGPKDENFRMHSSSKFYIDEIDVDDNTRFELHGFADASCKAYAAVVYLRIIRDDEVKIEFVAAKTRVAPMHLRISDDEVKIQCVGAKIRVAPEEENTIPKLELLACLLLSRLMRTIIDALKNIHIDRVCCWTDSMDCFYWINSSWKVWKRFVQNRVKEIRKNVPDVRWQHCPGKQNPADIPSRGLDIKPGKNRQVWLHGPEFLIFPDVVLDVDDKKFKRSCDEYVAASPALMITTDVEEKQIKGIGEIIQIDRFSYLERLLLVTCYILRFIYNCKHKTEPRVGEITAAEMDDARVIWIRYTQSDVIANKKYLNGLKSSLGAFIDESGVLRLRGRFQYAE